MNRKRPDEPPESHEGDDPSEGLPFPDTDLSPALQRTIKRQLDQGDDEDAPSTARFMRVLTRVARPDSPKAPPEPPAEAE